MCLAQPLGQIKYKGATEDGTPLDFNHGAGVGRWGATAQVGPSWLHLTIGRWAKLGGVGGKGGLCLYRCRWISVSVSVSVAEAISVSVSVAVSVSLCLCLSVSVSDFAAAVVSVLLLYLSLLLSLSLRTCLDLCRIDQPSPVAHTQTIKFCHRALA